MIAVKALAVVALVLLAATVPLIGIIAWTAATADAVRLMRQD